MNANVDNARQKRRESREQAERHTRRSMLRLIACASALRTGVTTIIPNAGSAAWWMFPLMLLPGLLLTLTFCLMMRSTRTRTLYELICHLLGAKGARAAALIWVLALFTDALLSFTALICLFTEGLGTEGTRFTLAMLTCAAMLFCLHQEGLPRGIHLLRWLLMIMLAIIAVNWGAQARPDHLFPWAGDGAAVLRSTAYGAMGMSWPLLLLLTEPPVVKTTGQARELLLPVLLCCAVMLLLALARPHLLAVAPQTVAQALIAPFNPLQAAVRTLGLCLLMLAFFLLTAGEACCAGLRLKEAVRNPIRYLPAGMIVLIGLVQLLPVQQLWVAASAVHRWLLYPFAVLCVVCLGAMVLGTRRCRR